MIDMKAAHATAPPDTQALVARSAGLTQQLADLAITNPREVAPAVLTRSLEGSAIIGRLADDYIREVKSGPAGTEGMGFDPLCRAADLSHKKLVAERDRLLKPAQKLKDEAGQLGWACNAELLRRQAEAEALAQQERTRLQREADEAARIEREAAQRAQDDALLTEATRLEQAGDTEAAARLVGAPPVVPLAHAAPVFVPPAPQIHVKVEGAPTFGATWGDFEVTDEAVVPEQFWMRILNDKLIRAHIVSMHDRHGIPGIKAVPRPRSTFRRAG